MTRPPVDLAICVDDGMVMPATVALSSIAETADPARSVRVHVVTNAREENLAPIRALARSRFDIAVVTVENPYALFPGSSYISPGTYLRFLLPQILEVDRVLYLDADIIATRDITQLFDAELGDYAIGAVPDFAMSLGSLQRDDYGLYIGENVYSFAQYLDKVLGLRGGRDAYFNAGVLLIDLEAWRRTDFIGRVVTYLHAHDNLNFMDQDGLNMVCRGRYLRLDPRWNSVVAATAARAGGIRRYVGPRARRWEKICRMWLEDPWIAHFAGPRKPWNGADAASVPLAPRWWACAMRSPARDLLATTPPPTAVAVSSP